MAETYYNREQKRKLKKRLARSGLSVDDALDLLTRRVQAMNAEALPEGAKVRLNYDSIVDQPSYQKRQQAYRDFVEENRDKIFTVAYDDKHQSGKLVLLQEDTSEQQWLWHCADLIRVDDIANEIASDSNPDNEVLS